MNTSGHSLDGERLGSTGETELRELLVVPIPHEIAAPFIRANHYSHKAPTGKNVFFGCYLNRVLYAVANYGALASRTPEAQITDRPDANRDNTVELRRLCRLGLKHESKIKTAKFLKNCHRLLKLMGIRYVLSYSDWQHNKFDDDRPDVAHRSGGIYLFAGFKHIGATPEEWHVIDTNTGEPLHRGRAYKRMLAHNLKLCKDRGLAVERKTTGNEDRIWPASLSVATQKDAPFPEDKLWRLDDVRTWLGYQRVKCPPKDKWLLDLRPQNKPGSNSK